MVGPSNLEQAPLGTMLAVQQHMVDASVDVERTAIMLKGSWDLAARVIHKVMNKVTILTIKVFITVLIICYNSN